MKYGHVLARFSANVAILPEKFKHYRGDRHHARDGREAHAGRNPCASEYG